MRQASAEEQRVTLRGSARDVADVHVRQLAAGVLMRDRVHDRSERVDAEREEERGDEARAPAKVLRLLHGPSS